MRKINKFGYLLVFIIPTFILLFLLLRIEYLLYVIPILMFLIVPIIDPIVGVDANNFDVDEEKLHLSDMFYKNIMYFWAITQTLIMLGILFFFMNNSLSVSTIVLLLINTMIMNGGVGIVVAHELGHKNDNVDRFFAKLLLLQVAYGHFTVEHNRGHHVHVGTELDPATGKYNQSFYSFWYQSVVYGFLHAIKIEREYLLLKKKKNSIMNNEVFRSLLISFILFALASGLVYYFNPQVFVYFLFFIVFQAILSFSLLEAVNYIEHYAILRRTEHSGKYEKINPTHSWNANFILSNYLLFQLQRHSDHHLFSTKNYQILKQYDESPQLPNGYPAMVVLALIPSLWKRIMNRRLNTWIKLYEGK